MAAHRERLGILGANAIWLGYLSAAGAGRSHADSGYPSSRPTTLAV